MATLSGNNTSHSLLSASGAFRWSVCPASAILEAKITEPPKVSSEAAREGTALHAVVEECLLSGKDAYDVKATTMEDSEGNPSVLVLNDEQQTAVQVVLDYVRALGGRMSPEQRVYYGEVLGVPDDVAFGTGDVTVIRDNELHIIDAKFGRTRVAAKDNTQLLLYAIGVYHIESLSQDFDSIHVHIMQPRVSYAGDEWVISPEELRAGIKKLQPPAQHIVDFVKRGKQPEKADYAPGSKTCFFCKSSGACPAQIELAQSAVLEDFKDMGNESETVLSLSAQRLGELVALAEKLSPFIDAVSAEAKTRLKSGAAVPGFKLVRAKAGIKSWTDADKAKNALLGLGFSEEEIMKPASLETPAKILGLVKVKKKDSPEEVERKEQVAATAAEFYTQADDAVSMVPADAPGDAVTFSAKADDF